MATNLQNNNDLGNMLLDASPKVPQELRDIAQQCPNTDYLDAMQTLSNLHLNRKSQEDWFPILVLWLNIRRYTEEANMLLLTDEQFEQPFCHKLSFPVTEEQLQSAVIHFLSDHESVPVDPVISLICIPGELNSVENKCLALCSHPWISTLKQRVKAPLAELYYPVWGTYDLEKVGLFQEGSLFC